MANQPLVQGCVKELAHLERVNERNDRTLRIGKMVNRFRSCHWKVYGFNAVIPVPHLSKLHQESVRRFMCEERVDNLWRLVGAYYGRFLDARPSVWDSLSSTTSQSNAVKSFDPNQPAGYTPLFYDSRLLWKRKQPPMERVLEKCLQYAGRFNTATVPDMVSYWKIMSQLVYAKYNPSETAYTLNIMPVKLIKESLISTPAGH